MDENTQALINIHIKMGQIFILDTLKNLDSLLINNGIMIIKFYKFVVYWHNINLITFRIRIRIRPDLKLQNRSGS